MTAKYFILRNRAIILIALQRGLQDKINCNTIMGKMAKHIYNLYQGEEREEERMNPIIGITPSMEGEGKVFLHRSYSDAVIRAGGIPLVIPFVTEPDTIRQIASCLDGLLLSGGEDIDPAYFDEEPLPRVGDVCPERDQLEVTLCQYFMKMDKPIFAICRGCQILNVAAGGDIYQDLFTQRQGLIQHIQRAPKSHASHQVQVVEGTQLHRMIGAKSYRVQWLAPSSGPAHRSSFCHIGHCNRWGDRSL